jgi:hypothetical protein
LDIVAKKVGSVAIDLLIEAKGETSDRQGSARYGKPFNSAQVRDHVANAFYCAASLLDPSSVSFRVGIALPETAQHRDRMSAVRTAIERLGIGVFRVGSDGDVNLEASWSL